MLTLENATHEVDELVRQVLAHLNPLGSVKIAGDPTPCDDPTDGGEPGRVTAVAQYEVYIAGDLLPHVDTLHTWLTGNGFQILKDARPNYLWAERLADGFRMAVQTNDLGAFFVTATSPCVWP
ncbi:hypothetical protein JOF56_011151 [Kibdelosporangium banguiense]|uniref:Uncharacterized protein n=1 Tax=Kibdelosporangium banguiense TaxID=1365924 RepID=A0ABS4U2B8_9PSEU|nr:hypothetical protein [Kibdelosporangium banguiense]MBP2330766.1 hypothetical protein [Kibdelosporangium banguiense]